MVPGTSDATKFSTCVPSADTSNATVPPPVMDPV
jgi:hypothetical protein